jgi:hypothetical protein
MSCLPGTSSELLAAAFQSGDTSPLLGSAKISEQNHFGFDAFAEVLLRTFLGFRNATMSDNVDRADDMLERAPRSISLHAPWSNRELQIRNKSLCLNLVRV